MATTAATRWRARSAIFSHLGKPPPMPAMNLGLS